MSRTTLDRLIEITRAFYMERGDMGAIVGPDAAICQDLLIFGADVEDYVGLLEDEFGPSVSEIPWMTYTDQTSSFRGCAVLVVPFWLLYRLARKLIESGPVVPRPDPRSHPYRLTLRQIAEVIDRGGWPSDRGGTA